jgi:hypothetical protein
MQTTITIDNKLIEEAAKLVDIQNQNQIIEMALQEFIKKHSLNQAKSKLLKLYGAGGIREDYDYKALRNEEDK